jgi:hypothetical protein
MSADVVQRIALLDAFRVAGICPDELRRRGNRFFGDPEHRLIIR